MVFSTYMWSLINIYIISKLKFSWFGNLSLLSGEISPNVPDIFFFFIPVASQCFWNFTYYEYIYFICIVNYGCSTCISIYNIQYSIHHVVDVVNHTLQHVFDVFDNLYSNLPDSYPRQATTSPSPRTCHKILYREILSIYFSWISMIVVCIRAIVAFFIVTHISTLNKNLKEKQINIL